MAQYSLGTVTVTQGSPIVAGVGTFWSNALAAGQLFALKADTIWYEILSVDGDGQITLKSNYIGVTKSAAIYLVQRDFTPNNSYPTPTYGDSGTSSLIAQTLLQLEAQIVAMSATMQALQGNITVDGSLSITANGGMGALTAISLALSSLTTPGVLTNDSGGNVSSATLLTLLTSVIAGLPTTEPGTGGVLWLNGRQLALS